MMNEADSVMMHFQFPLHLHIELLDAPLYKCTVYFDTEELVEVTFKVNPAEPINVQHMLACLCVEDVISGICDAVKWQSACMAFYQHCAEHKVPQQEAVTAYMAHRAVLYGQVQAWSNKADNIGFDDDDDNVE
jgi:hypothetical protein